MTEAALMRRIMLALSRAGAVVFRNNQGALKDATGRLVRYGVCQPGGADVIGWRSIEVTPEMVGQRVALFAAVEVKTLTGRLTPAQRQFLDAVRSAGGIAGVARSEDEAVRLLG
jgi:hypothetical protein